MIKRTYFFSVRVSHDNNSGNYSWWNAIINTKCWVQNKDELLTRVRELAAEELQQKLNRKIGQGDIQVIALNKI